MTKNFKVNFLSNSIEVTTSFAKKASIYGSTEYLMLNIIQGFNSLVFFQRVFTQNILHYHYILSDRCF